MKVKTSLFITTLLLAGLFFLPLSANMSNAGVAPPGPPEPTQKAGCCTTEDESGQCIGCPEGATCLTGQDFCESEEGFFAPGSCFDDGGGATCENEFIGQGCCIVEPGSCADDVDAETCFTEVSLLSDQWVGNTSCSDIPRCTPTRNIPTMSNWGLIALAGIFILAGIWAITRKKTEA